MIIMIIKCTRTQVVILRFMFLLRVPTDFNGRKLNARNVFLFLYIR